MKETKYVVFDFDGTLADTFDLALKIYNRIAPEYNCTLIGHEDRELLRTERPQKLFKEYGFTDLKVFLLLLRMRKELSKHIPDIGLVKGIKDSLLNIKKAGYNLGILTSNSKNNVSKFLEYNDMSGLIDFIYSGKGLFGKDRVIRRMLDSEKILRENVIYVGDETRDIEASKKAGIPVIAVTWGLNNREVLSSMGPDCLADDPQELYSCVMAIQ